MELCNNSVVNFYFKIAGLSSTNVKFDGLNSLKSRELYESFLGILAEIGTIVAQDNGSGQVFIQELASMGLKPHQINEVSDFYFKSRIFPSFQGH
jgi:hypothetical protein